MSDTELIDLAHAKEPEDFSAAEIGRLRRAVRRSPAVRESVAARIRTEEYLAASLGRPALAVDLILARQANKAARRSSLGWRWGTAAVAVVLALASAVGVRGFLRPRLVSQAAVSRPLPQEGFEPPAAIAGPLPADDPAEPLRRAESGGPGAIPALQGPALQGPALQGPAQTAEENPGPAAAAVGSAADPEPGPWPAISVAEAAAMRFARPGPADSSPSQADLERWFSPLEGRPLTFGEQAIEGRRCGTLDGVARLARPLAGQSLRLALHQPAGLRLHCWSGDRGVTIVLHHKSGPWWAYATSRTEGGPLPASFALAARDGWRLARAPATSLPVQVLDLRQEADRLLVSTGDVTILDVPCPGVIDEIICEGKATFRQLALLPPLELPPVLAASGDEDFARRALGGGNLAGVGPAPRDERVPAMQEWGSQSLPAGSRLALDDEGGIELATESPSQPAWAMLPLPDRGGWMWTFELSAADPGTGLCLGDAAGNPVRVVRLMRGKGWEGARLCELVAAGDNRAEADANPYERPQPFVAGCPRIRLFSCGGMLRCWIAAAGSHDWVEAFDPLMEGGPQAVWVGLHAAAGQGSRSIRLARCVGTPPVALAAVGGPAGEDLAVLGPACPKAEALAALERLGAAVAAAADQPLPVRLAMLREIAVRAPVWGDPAAAASIARLYESAGLELAGAGMPAPYSALAAGQQTAPLAIAEPFSWFPATLARRELLELVGDRSWGDAAQVAGRIRFFGFDAAPPLQHLMAWAAETGRRLSAPRAMSRAGLLPTRGVDAAWLHPLVIEISKEAFNFHADFEAACAAGAWPDAAAMLAAAGPAVTGSLVPDGADPDLAMRLDAAGDAAVAGRPGFQDAMRTASEGPGLLRFRMLSARGDAAGVEGVARSFPGTQAAAEAEAWLAARSLAVGRFQAARRHVARGLPWSSGETAERLAAITKLLVEPGAAGPAKPLPAGGLNATVVGRLEGDVGGNPGGLPGEYRNGWPGVAGGSIDWAGRQAAVAAAGSDLLVSNRFQLACFAAGMPQARWRVGLGPAAGDTHAWGGQPMRPVVAGDTVFMRLLEKPGPRLGAVAVADGSDRWMLPSTETCQFVSDPLLSGDALLIVAATKGEGTWQLSLRCIRPADGTPRWDRPLVTLRESWWPIRDCQLAAADDGSLVIACGGSLIACDDEGAVRWLRRLPWVPAAVDPLRLEQEHSPPVISGQAVYALLPGVPGLVAVERSSGRRLWSCPLATARKIIAVDETAVGPVLAVATSAGLVGLRGGDGSVAWRLAADGLLDGSCAATVASGRAAIVGFAAGTAAADGRREPVMLCVAAGTGEVLGRQAFAALADPAPRVAPVAAGPGELRLLFGRGPDDPTRDLVVIAP